METDEGKDVEARQRLISGHETTLLWRNRTNPTPSFLGPQEAQESGEAPPRPLLMGSEALGLEATSPVTHIPVSSLYPQTKDADA